jgi:hypothetical protein
MEDLEETEFQSNVLDHSSFPVMLGGVGFGFSFQPFPIALGVAFFG